MAFKIIKTKSRKKKKGGTQPFEFGKFMTGLIVVFFLVNFEAIVITSFVLMFLYGDLTPLSELIMGTFAIAGTVMTGAVGFYQWKTKAKEWAYEQEVRLVMPRPSAMYAALTPEQVNHPKETWDWREIRHYVPLKGECFESIYFGVNTDSTEKEKVIQYARKKLNPQIKLYQMKVDENAFRLRAEVMSFETRDD